MGSWLDRAKRIIAEMDRELSADATLADRKKALRHTAWSAHQGTSWGKQTWLQARAEYLAKHGAPKPVPTKFRRRSPITGKVEIVDMATLPLFPEARR